MGKVLYETDAHISSLYQDAEKVLGYDVRALCFDGPVEQLNQTEFKQPLRRRTGRPQLRPPVVSRHGEFAVVRERFSVVVCALGA